MYAAITVLILTLTFVLSPLVTSPFSGFRADQTPIPQIDPPIQPEGYAFAIWGVIYSWLLVSAIFGLWKRRDDVWWRPVRLPLIVSLGVGTFWLGIANASPIWATITIWIMLLSAVAALWRAPQTDRWWLRAPLALYAGWLSAASFVALGATLAGFGVAGLDATQWAYVLLIVAICFAGSLQSRLLQAPEYGFAVSWALVAIVVANWQTVAGIALLAAVGAILMGLLALRSAKA